VQLTLLLQRKARDAVRHPWLFIVTFVGALTCAVLMGAVYAHMGYATPGIQDRFASFFFVNLFLSLSSLSSLPIWHAERAVFARERAAGAYGTLAYVTASLAVDLAALRVAPTAFLATLGYSLMGLRPGVVHCLIYWAAVTAANVAATAMAMAIGAAASAASVANLLGSLAVLANLLFSGFLLSLHALPRPVEWLSRFSFARYAFEVLSTNEFRGAKNFRLTPFAPPGTDPMNLPHVDVNGDEILSIFYLGGGAGIRANLLSLLGIAATYIVATIMILHWQRPSGA
jgi:ABC-2 type transporter